MARQAVMFDLDGTLLDTLDDLADSMNRVLADFGMPPHPVDSYRYFVGDGMEVLARRVATPGTADAVVAEMAERMNRYYGDNWHNKTKPYPGIPELLDELSRLGVRMAVLSNKPHQFTTVVVSRFFGNDRFLRVRGASPERPKKPDPASAIEMAAEIGVPPGGFLYLGDTNTDMRTGRNAGMFTVGASWGFRPIAELLDAGAERIVDAPAEIPGLL